MKKISTTLSVATLALLQGCGAESDNADSIPLITNTTAPELVAKWTTGCSGTSVSSSNPVTSTGTSGGSGSGSSRGNFSITSFTFNQNGSAEVSRDDFSESNCNINFRVNSLNADLTYTVGNTTLDNNGMPAIELDLNYSNSTNYTIFRITGDTLYIADADNSNPSNNGSAANLRLDGFSSSGFNKE